MQMESDLTSHLPASSDDLPHRTYLWLLGKSDRPVFAQFLDEFNTAFLKKRLGERFPTPWVPNIMVYGD